jgi:hypothetical protein
MKEELDMQLIEDSIPYVNDVPKLRGTIMALIRYIRNLKDEIKFLKQCLKEKLYP